MHHDGGIEQASDLPDTGLAAADLVICQTGCISHQAYWRLKGFCKRTGKRCLYVDNPSTSSLSTCLRKASEPAEMEACQRAQDAGAAIGSEPAIAPRGKPGYTFVVEKGRLGHR